MNLKLGNYRHCPEPTQQTLIEMNYDMAEDAINMGKPEIAHKIIGSKKKSAVLKYAAMLYGPDVQHQILLTLRAEMMGALRKAEADERGRDDIRDAIRAAMTRSTRTEEI